MVFIHTRLHLNIPEHLNAEVALGTVKSGASRATGGNRASTARGLTFQVLPGRTPRRLTTALLIKGQSRRQSFSPPPPIPSPVDDAIQWLELTFFFVRVHTAPEHYCRIPQRQKVSHTCTQQDPS